PYHECGGFSCLIKLYRPLRYLLLYILIIPRRMAHSTPILLSRTRPIQFLSPTWRARFSRRTMPCMSYSVLGLMKCWSNRFHALSVPKKRVSLLQPCARSSSVVLFVTLVSIREVHQVRLSQRL